MNCRSFVRKADEYYDGVLPALELEKLEEHLSSCSECQQLVRELNGISSIVKELAAVKAPVDFEAGFLKKVNTSAAKERAIYAFWNSFRQARTGVYALLLIFLVAGFLLIQNSWLNIPQVRQTASQSHRRMPEARSNLPAPDRMDTPGYQEVLLQATDEEDVILRLPKTIRINPSLDNDYYFKNISH